MKNRRKFELQLPRSLDEAVDQIIAEMTMDEKVKVARLSENDLAPLKLALRVFVQNKLEESAINEELRASCVEKAGKELDEAGASTVIIDALWERLIETHGLKVMN